MNIERIPHLSDCIDLDNPYANKYIELISNPNDGDNLQGHHIVPAAFYKYVLGCEKVRLVSSLDMVPDNIVHLTKTNHVLAHYYLARCIKNPNNIFTDSQLYAFVNMFSKRVMKNHPLFDEMVEFAEQNKGVKRRYKQYDLCPPTIPLGCTFYKDAVIHTDRTGAWITQIRDHGEEHYTYDHFGNCLDIQIENLPCVLVVRSLSTGRVLTIASNVDEQYTYVGFAENGGCYLCHDWQGRIGSWKYQVNSNTYKFADAMYKMSNYIKQILTDREYSDFMFAIGKYVGKHSKTNIEPYKYYDIPSAPKRMYSNSHRDDMIKQCEVSAERWMQLYNDGIRPDGADAAHYYKELAQIWRGTDMPKICNNQHQIEDSSNTQIEPSPIKIDEPKDNSVPSYVAPKKVGFIQRLIAKLTFNHFGLA